MRHRTQLGEEKRQRGNERDAKLEAMLKSWQGDYLATEAESYHRLRKHGIASHKSAPRAALGAAPKASQLPAN